MSGQIQILSRKELKKEIRDLARHMKIDLSKADEKKTEAYLKEVPSLSKRIVRNRNR